MFKRMTAAQAVVDRLISYGVPYVIGIFGHGNVQLGEALAERTSEIMFIQAKNEQAAVHMALAYARHTGKPLAVTTSIGPGATNMVTGAAVGAVGRVPVLLLPGEAFVHRGKRGPVLQELEDQHGRTANDALRPPLSVYWERLTDAGKVDALMHEAFTAMLTPGSEGPAVICLPMDVQAEAAWFRTPKRIDSVFLKPPSPASLKAAAKTLLAAKRPLIIAGGGVIRGQAWEALEHLVNMLPAPVVHSQGGQGALLWNHPLNLIAAGPSGTPQGNRFAKRADVILAVGTRLDDFTTSSESAFAKDAKFITANVNAFDAGKASPVVQLVGGASQALRHLLREMERQGAPSVSPHWIADAQKARESWVQESGCLRRLEPNEEGLLPQSSVIGAINDALPDDAVIVAAAGSLPGDLLKLWRCRDETRKGYHLEYDFSTMGYEIPGAIGIKLADPERRVVALMGDGSFLMNPTEILTAVQERLPVTFVVIDSRGHRSIQGCQEGNTLQKFGTEYRMRNAESGLLDEAPLDFDIGMIAKGLGADVLIAKSRREIFEAMDFARRKLTIPTVIVIPVDTERTVPNFGWWDVPIPEVSPRPELNQARQEYEEKLNERTER